MAAAGEPPVFLERSARATRGKRMSKLLDEEIEGDEQFWGQDAFKEEEIDAEYEQEGEVADVFDSDFDDDEPEPDDEAVDDEEGRPVKKRRLFPGKPIIKKKSKKKGLSVTEVAEGSSHRSKPSQPKHEEVTVYQEGERTVRKSTRTAVIVRQAERDALRAALQASIKPVKRKKEGEERRMTQEEMLLEAAQTEIMNLRNLERMLAREEEVKKRAIVHKAVYGGPQIRFYSKDGKNILEFTKGSTFPSGVFSKSAPYPERLVCIVTGQPAKYRDPKTGLPYATKEAFKIIRESLSVENGGSKHDTDDQEKSCPRKRRSRDESCNGPGTKACREKMRRDKLNDRFMELSSVLDPGRPPKTDKGLILSDAVHTLKQLRSEAQKLKDSNDQLREAIKELKAEKNAFRDEKLQLKADKERLEQQLKAIAMPSGFLPHPAALHAAAAFAAQSQAAANKSMHAPGYPGVAMWQWMPPAVVDTSQDHMLRPPVA